MYCSKCGVQNDEAAKFCRSCGAPIQVTSPASPPPNQPPSRVDGPGVFGAVVGFILAIVLGCLSGLLISFCVSLVVRDNGGVTVAAWLVGWVVSVWLMARGARSASRVISRASLIGATEWLLSIPFVAIASVNAANQTTQTDGMASLAAGLGVTLYAILAFAMVLVCLVCWVISHNIGRELRPERRLA